MCSITLFSSSDPEQCSSMYVLLALPSASHWSHPRIFFLVLLTGDDAPYCLEICRNRWSLKSVTGAVISSIWLRTGTTDRLESISFDQILRIFTHLCIKRFLIALPSPLSNKYSQYLSRLRHISRDWGLLQYLTVGAEWRRQKWYQCVYSAPGSRATQRASLCDCVGLSASLQPTQMLLHVEEASDEGRASETF